MAAVIWKSMAELVIDSVDWAQYPLEYGDPHHVRQLLLDMMRFSNADHIEGLYSELENLVVSQGTIEKIALPTIRVMLAALLESRPPAYRVAVYNLFFLILNGWAVDNVSKDLINQCRAAIREGTWLLMKEYVYDMREAAKDVLDRLELSFDYEKLIPSLQQG